MRYLSLLLLLTVIGLGFSHLAYADKKQEIETVFQQWVKSISSGDVEQVLALYDTNAISVPTTFPRLAHSQEERRKNLSGFIDLPGLYVDIDESHIRIFGNTAVNTGRYTFHYIKNGQKEAVLARFSFTYLYTPEGWKIVDHHSSKMPETAPAGKIWPAAPEE